MRFIGHIRNRVEKSSFYFHHNSIKLITINKRHRLTLIVLDLFSFHSNVLMNEIQNIRCVFIWKLPTKLNEAIDIEKHCVHFGQLLLLLLSKKFEPNINMNKV